MEFITQRSGECKCKNKVTEVPNREVRRRLKLKPGETVTRTLHTDSCPYGGKPGGHLYNDVGKLKGKGTKNK